jgi:hypothetical protein
LSGTEAFPLPPPDRRQHTIDTVTEPPPRRLLILSCSATKARTPGLLSAEDRYLGALWQVAKKHDRLAQRAQRLALSAEFGLIHATKPIPWYDRRMDRDRVSELVEAAELSALAEIVNRSGGLDEICLCGAAPYVQCARQMLIVARDKGVLAGPMVPTEIINGPIGEMRRDLRLWLLGEAA